MAANHTGFHTNFHNCRCGFYAVGKPEELDLAIASTFGSDLPLLKDLVAGMVTLWGTVEIGDNGYRASNARIEALIAPTSDHMQRLGAVASYYGVPLHLDRELGLRLGTILQTIPEFHFHSGWTSVLMEARNRFSLYVGSRETQPVSRSVSE
jgi:hypothetical protein